MVPFPLDKVKSPDDPARAVPVETDTAPDDPVDDIPVNNCNDPLAPLAPEFPVAIVITPLVVDVPTPLSILIEPPVLSNDCPACKNILDPAADCAIPIDKIMEPGIPLLVVPVDNIILPEVFIALPVLIVALPEEPL